MSEASLWQRLLPLALGAAVSPLLLLGQLAQLTAPGSTGRALGRGAAYLLGTLLVVLVWSGCGGWIAARLPARQPGPDPVAAVLELMLALALVCLTVRIVCRLGPDNGPEPAALVRSPSLLRAWLQGLSLMAANITSLVLFLPASQDVGRSGLPLPQQGLAWLGLDAITLLPAWLTLLLVVLSGPVGAESLRRLGGWVSSHRRAIDGGVAAAFALVLLGRGLAEL